MRRHLVPLLLLAAPLTLTAVGCNCGKPITMMTQASVTLPVEILDFGVVPEGTSKRANFQVENVGRAPVKVTITIDPDKSQEFALGQFSDTIEAGGSIDVPVTFTPAGPGIDEGAALVATEGQEMPLRMNLKGGPIEPRLAFVPNPLSFGPGNLPLERKQANIRSVGTSALNVRSVGVDPTGNPYFAIVPPSLPSKLLPGESLAVIVEYTRTARNDTGFMEARFVRRSSSIPPADHAVGIPSSDFRGTVEIDINRFQIQASSVRPLPDQPYFALPVTMQPTCPNGTFTYTRTEVGGCDETFTLTGTFTGTNTFVGTYSVAFSGPQCAGADCGGLDCVDQSWNIWAGR